MKNRIILASLLLGSLAYGQIKVHTGLDTSIGNENPFLDASAYNNFNNNVGKGLYFPTTDLTTWEFKTNAINPGKFKNYFDGMIVYNSGTGKTLEDASKGGKQVSVTPGFYYFKNPNQTAPSGSVANGEWVRLEGKNIYTEDGTLTADRTVNLNNKKLKFTGGVTTVEASSYYPLLINSTQAAGGGLGLITNGDQNKRVELSVNGDGNFRLWANADRLFVNRESGNVGIGTNTPTYKLDISGNARVLSSSDHLLRMQRNGSSDFTDIVKRTNGVFLITNRTGDAWKGGISINSEGNVGVGNENPSEKLEVTGNAKITGLAGSGDRAVVADANGKLKTVAISSLGSDTNLYNSNGTLTSERKVNLNGKKLLFTGSGNIGIGTDGPTSKLEIKGDNWFPLVVNTTNTGGGGIAISPNDFSKRVELSATQDGNFRMYMGSFGDRLLINSSKGTTRINGDYAIVKGDGDENAYIGGDGAANDVQIGSTNNNVNDITFWNTNGRRMNIAANDVSSGNNTYTQNLTDTQDIKVRALAGSGDRAVVADANGKLKTVAISSLGSDNNLYNSDGILSANRTVNMNGNSLTFSGNNAQIKVPAMQDRPASENVSGVVMGADGMLKKDTGWWRLGDGAIDKSKITINSIFYLSNGGMIHYYGGSIVYEGPAESYEGDARLGRCWRSNIMFSLPPNYLKDHLRWYTSQKIHIDMNIHISKNGMLAHNSVNGFPATEYGIVTYYSNSGISYGGNIRNLDKWKCGSGYLAETPLFYLMAIKY